MSVQFGSWNRKGQPINTALFDRARILAQPYAPDGYDFHCMVDLGMAYSAFHTTPESRKEKQPSVTASGNVFTWDGRLDNRTELIDRLGPPLIPTATDLEIVIVAYERWGTEAFARLVGDWALVIHRSKDRSLLLAKDSIGIKHLYYTFDDRHVSWCTILDPLILLSNKSHSLCEEYIAGCLSCFPAVQLTPYEDIRSVAPASFVVFNQANNRVAEYWRFDPSNVIQFSTDSEYEEQFRDLFKQAVRRRLRSDKPILAELSGGMDSSSIVSVADLLTGEAPPEFPSVFTVSYFDTDEPNWSEHSFFMEVEKRRGQSGCHIDISGRALLTDCAVSCPFPSTPAAGSPLPEKTVTALAQYMCTKQTRVVLSGIGGDEVTGGIPTPLPELRNYMASGDLRSFIRQTKAWALNKRKPWFHLAYQAVRGFLPLPVSPADFPVPFWLTPRFRKQYAHALTGYPNRLTLRGPMPSFQENLSTLRGLQRQAAYDVPLVQPLFETRYPFLDRDLLAMIYGTPRQQMVRVGQRRSLMRRALAGIVPEVILDRKRKAFVSKKPMIQVASEWERLEQLTQNLLSASLDIVDPIAFSCALRRARKGLPISIIQLIRTLELESWLVALAARGTLPQPMALERHFA
jgi:asparagine synthase (glutamine-hydrolysing)